MANKLRIIKRFFTNILLLAVFGVALAALAAPLFAEVAYRFAQRKAWNQDWLQAEAGFARATALVPISAEYLVGYADFLWEKAVATEDDSALKQAGPLYARAVEANPVCAECLIKKGRFEFATGDIKAALNHFHAARQIDPNGRDTTFRLADTARALLEMDLNYLKEVIALDQKYFTGPRGTALIAEAFRENLLGTPDAALLIELKKRLQEYEGDRNVVQPDQWLGISLDGKIPFTDGHLTAAGTVDALVNLSKRRSTLIIRARGIPADDVAPFMLVELDGAVIGHRFVAAADWQDYTFEVNRPEGPKVLSITFANGSSGPQSGQRQLHIERAWVQ